MESCRLCDEEFPISELIRCELSKYWLGIDQFACQRCLDIAGCNYEPDYDAPSQVERDRDHFQVFLDLK